MKKTKSSKKTNDNNGLNLIWFISATIIFSLTFFTIRYWIKGEPYEPYIPMHLRKKVQVKVYDNQNNHRARGYNVSY